MLLNLPYAVKYCILTLENAGFEAYAVGGCVRDLLMGKTPLDYDITTSAKPSEVKKLFDNTADTGIKHGTVTVIIDSMPIEVTTYRTETGYSDFRRPDGVSFVSDIKEDLSRRDFTVNAICYNPKSGIKDLFGGCDDIRNKILRTVGDPEKRFYEDALRIMRLIRFKSVLGFEIEKNTLTAAEKMAYLIKNVSCERIYSELKKTLGGENPAAISELISAKGLESFGITKISTPEKIALADSFELKLYLFLKLCECDIFNTLKLLKAETKTVRYAENIDSLLIDNPITDRCGIKRLFNRYSPRLYTDAVKYLQITENKDYGYLLLAARDIIKSDEPYSISQLNINGNDLKKLGINGTDTGKTLDFLLDEVIKNPENNTYTKLLEIISEMQ